MAIEFKLPDLGENIESGTIARVLVSEGDAVEAEQPVLELETDKAVLEVPAPAGGVVKTIHVKEGDQISVGQLILTLEEGAGAPAKPAEEKAVEPEEIKKSAEEKPAAPVPTGEVSPPPTDVPSPTVAPEPPVVGEVAPAAPSVRRFAREIGIDINQVPGSGPGGRISIDDVKRYAKRLNQQRQGAGALITGVTREKLPDFSKWGEIERQPMSNIRRKTAEHLGYAWLTVPHVTQFDKADITDLEKMRKQYAAKVEQSGGKLTMTAILVKLLATALKKFPQFNASVDMESNEIIFKKYYHIGVAVDTPNGLLVPVIRDADRKNITEISVELGELAAKARNRKLSLEEMQGGTFSISNLGGIGGTGFTPIVNTPEVAILGVSRSQIEPLFRENQFVPRLMLPLSLSYDHRLIDGADAARFLRWVAETLEQPFLSLLEG